MKSFVNSIVLVACGVLLGVIGTERMLAQQRGVRVNHVGVTVKNMNESIAFYTKVMGYREAFTLRDANGNATLSAMQISRDTFLELAPANPTRPIGFSHVGIEADDIAALVAQLRQAGTQAADPRVLENSGVSVTSVTDPNGLRVEFLQLNPGSLHRQAVDSWK